MYKSILLTVDLEHEASWKKALPEAARIARDDEAVLHVLAVVPDFGSPLVAADFPPDFQKKAVDRARKRLEEIRDDPRKDPTDPDVVREMDRLAAIAFPGTVKL